MQYILAILGANHLELWIPNSLSLWWLTHQISNSNCGRALSCFGIGWQIRLTDFSWFFLIQTIKIKIKETKGFWVDLVQPANQICSARNYEGKEDNDIKAYTNHIQIILAIRFWKKPITLRGIKKKKKRNCWKFFAMFSKKLISYLSLIRLGFMVYKLKKIWNY